MMVETILESSQDFGMSNGALPQWKRELLQRRAARTRGSAVPASPPPPPPPPPPADDNDEELRYGPGIVKRLKSRYLSLAVRDAPRRRPSVLRRATSLEHLLDERPPPAPRAAARAPRPASVAAAPPPAAAARRDFVKRARSVDALSRLDSREELAPPSPSPPPPPAPRAPRPPRRPAPLLRETERPPPDVVRSTLRKFESAPPRRAAPAARVSAVLRGLEGARRSLTPERQEPEHSAPAPDPVEDHPTAPPLPATPPPPSTAAPPLFLEPAPPATPSPSPSPAPASPPAFTFPSSPSPIPTVPAEIKSTTTAPTGKPAAAPRAQSPAAAPPPPVAAAPPPAIATPPPGAAPPASVDEPEGGATSAVRAVSRAALDGIARAGSSVRYAFPAARGGDHLPPLAATNHAVVARGARRVGVIRPMPASPRAPPAAPPAPAPEKRAASPPPAFAAALVNGHSTPEPRAAAAAAASRIGAAGIERAWSGSAARGRAARAPPASTSVVFNFSNRKEVPDYIENDGIILRAGRRNRIKAGEPGVVVLRPELARADSDSDAEAEAEARRTPSPCAVRFVNDNVLINGRSSMPPRRDRDVTRIANLKLQFDDSLTRTFEYPSETSLCEDSPPPAPAPAPAPHDPAALVDNTHIASAALSRYTPSKTSAAAFTLGVTRHAPHPPAHPQPHPHPQPVQCVVAGGAGAGAGAGAEGACEEGGGDARPCGADAARSWSDARALATDLLF